MITPIIRRSFIFFHFVLGLGLLTVSAETFVRALNNGGQGHAILAGTEALGALLFVFLRTLRVGGAVLLVTLLGACTKNFQY